MKRATRQKNAFVKGIVEKFGLNTRQGRVAWGEAFKKFDRAPARKDIKAHPRIIAAIVKKAPRQEAARRAAQTRAVKKEAPKPEPAKKAPERPAPIGGAPGARVAGKGRRIETLSELLEIPDYEWESVNEEDTGGIDTE